MNTNNLLVRVQDIQFEYTAVNLLSCSYHSLLVCTFAQEIRQYEQSHYPRILLQYESLDCFGCRGCEYEDFFDESSVLYAAEQRNRSERGLGQVQVAGHVLRRDSECSSI